MDINHVRYMMCPVWWTAEQGGDSYWATWLKVLEELPAGLDNARELGLAVMLDLHTVPNDAYKEPDLSYIEDATERRNLASHAWWQDESNLEVMIKCWRQLARLCVDREQELWYEIYNEPLDWTRFPNSPERWPRWAQQIIDEIRKIDENTPIAVQPGPGSLCWGLKSFPRLKGDPIVYAIHNWNPHYYTHQGVYGPKDAVANWEGGAKGRAYFEEDMAAAIEFQKRHNVRIWVSEFGVARWAPDAAQYLRDSIEFFEAHGWDWSYHSFREAGPWDLERVSRRGTLDHADGLTDRGRVVREFLRRNLD